MTINKIKNAFRNSGVVGIMLMSPEDPISLNDPHRLFAHGLNSIPENGWGIKIFLNFIKKHDA